MRKIIYTSTCTLLLLLCFGLTAFAQSLIRGKVIDKKGNPVQGASISVIDADNRILTGTSTDIEGNFVLKNVNSKNRLTITNIGFKSQTIPERWAPTELLF